MDHIAIRVEDGWYYPLDRSNSAALRSGLILMAFTFVF
jgi:hypothetical protein